MPSPPYYTPADAFARWRFLRTLRVPVSVPRLALHWAAVNAVVATVRAVRRVAS